MGIHPRHLQKERPSFQTPPVAMEHHQPQSEGIDGISNQSRIVGGEFVHSTGKWGVLDAGGSPLLGGEEEFEVGG